jgi:hypothetical protein
LASIGDIFFTLRSDDSQLQVDAAKSGTAAGTALGSKMSSALQGVMQGIGQQAFRDITQGIGDIESFIKGSIQVADQLNKSIAKTNIVFGASAQEVTIWAATTADSMGTSSEAALTMASSLGNLLIAQGLSQGAAASMSESVLQLAADEAAFNDIPMPDALNAIQMGLSGGDEGPEVVGHRDDHGRGQREGPGTGIHESRRGV